MFRCFSSLSGVGAVIGVTLTAGYVVFWHGQHLLRCYRFFWCSPVPSPTYSCTAFNRDKWRTISGAASVVPGMTNLNGPIHARPDARVPGVTGKYPRW
jgi:hypothetical protein